MYPIVPLETLSYCPSIGTNFTSISVLVWPQESKSLLTVFKSHSQCLLPPANFLCTQKPCWTMCLTGQCPNSTWHLERTLTRISLYNSIIQRMSKKKGQWEDIKRRHVGHQSAFHQQVLTRLNIDESLWPLPIPGPLLGRGDQWHDPIQGTLLLHGLMSYKGRQAGLWPAEGNDNFQATGGPRPHFSST